MTMLCFQLWFTRIALLVKTQQIDVAMNEMVPFGNLDSPDLYFQHYPELYGNGKCGSMVPFSFRLLAAELPAYANKINEAQEKLCQLLVVVRRIIQQVDQFITANGSVTDKENALRLWSDRELRVIHSLVNCALLKKVSYFSLLHSFFA
jgi:trafficking protein particle complex subunit 12